MPNWTRNKVIVRGSEAILRKMVAETMTVDINQSLSFDFNTLVPMPKDLSNAVSSTVSKDGASILFENKDFPKSNFINNNFLSRAWVKNQSERTINWALSGFLDSAKPSQDIGSSLVYPNWMGVLSYMQNSDLGMLLPEDRYYDTGFQAIQNIKKYGSADWYDWSLDKWGTKWNACSSTTWNVSGKRKFRADIEFDTAWSAPFPIFQALADKYQVDVQVRVNYEGEPGWEKLDFFPSECNNDFSGKAEHSLDSSLGSTLLCSSKVLLAKLLGSDYLSKDKDTSVLPYVFSHNIWNILSDSSVALDEKINALKKCSKQEILSVNEVGENLLFLAIVLQNADLVRILLECGVDVNQQDGMYGMSPLHTALYWRNGEIINQIVPLADWTVKNKLGQSAGDVAATLGLKKWVEYAVLEKGCSCDFFKNQVVEVEKIPSNLPCLEMVGFIDKALITAAIFGHEKQSTIGCLKKNKKC